MPVSSFKTQTFLALFFLCATITVGCKKEKAAVTYSITYTGGQYVGETVYFTTNEPAGSNFVWYFGDSTTSASPNPSHAYTAAGVYTVTFEVSNANTITKTISIGADSIQMSMINGSYLCHHSNTLYFCTPSTTISYYSDTPLTVRMIDPATISVGVDTLTYWTSTAGSLSFAHTFYIPGNGTYYPTGSYSNLYFYPGNDSLSYQFFDHISACGSTVDSYTTP